MRQADTAARFPSGPGAIKICGIRQGEHALVAADAGATMLGFVFAPSKRQIQAGEAAEIVEAVRSRYGDGAPLMVGVFVEPSREELERAMTEVGLDFAQVHGNVDLAALADVPVPVIRGLAPISHSDADSVVASIEADERVLGRNLPVLLDAHVPGQLGGTGIVGDWSLAREVSERRPILLAGGLNPENVAAAITSVRPAGVDVSSGVEIDGVKDPERIQAFVAAAENTFHNVANHRVYTSSGV
jgi:phosphoribosylanthranilate isomerase